MRITTQMVNESARKSGLPINNTSLQIKRAKVVDVELIVSYSCYISVQNLLLWK